MSKDDNSKGGKAKNHAERLARVRRLYRQAERSVGGLAEPEQPWLGQERGSGQAPEAPEPKPGAAEREQVPEWILSVLEDLAGFARENNLPEVRECLLEAHRRVRALRDRKSGD
jgi:hypothetical protein